MEVIELKPDHFKWLFYVSTGKWTISPQHCIRIVSTAPVRRDRKRPYITQRRDTLRRTTDRRENRDHCIATSLSDVRSELDSWLANWQEVNQGGTIDQSSESIRVTSRGPLTVNQLMSPSSIEYTGFPEYIVALLLLSHFKLCLRKRFSTGAELILTASGAILSPICITGVSESLSTPSSGNNRRWNWKISTVSTGCRATMAIGRGGERGWQSIGLFLS